ncbi:MAG: CBS domain-containing protein [bacterium]|nr:CBS domain-containing protein [bacterium]
MLYLSQLLGISVLDATGEEIGKVSDLAISTGEVFPRITSVAFLGPAKTPFMVSWRKYVDEFDGERIKLNLESHNIRFSYLQPDELLLARDLLNKQIVDTQGLKVVRVNDLKLSQSGNILRLLGAETGVLGILRGLHPIIEKAVVGISKLFRHPLKEQIIAWNYMDLVDRDLSQVKLSVTHKRLHELHPADIADILEQLDPQQRARVFEHLDSQNAADTVAELEDEFQSDLIEDMSEHRASELLAQMDPDDAADILGDLPYEKAEALLWLMGVQDQRRIRALLGYKEKSAGGIMTTEFITASEATTVEEAIAKVRDLGREYESVHYIYLVDSLSRLCGAVSLRELVLADQDTPLGDISTNEIVSVSPEVDQEEVAEMIQKYDLLAIPVVDDGKMLGIVTIDDAIDVMEEEYDEDLMFAGAGKTQPNEGLRAAIPWFLRRMMWVIVWAIVAGGAFLMGAFDSIAEQILVMPISLIIADVVGSLSLNLLIDIDEGQSAGIGRLFGRNIVIALVVTAVIGLLAAAILGIAGDRFSAEYALGIATFANLALPLMICVFVTIVLGTLFSAIGLVLHRKDKILSDLPVSLILMVIAIAIQLAAAVLIGQSGL